MVSWVWIVVAVIVVAAIAAALWWYTGRHRSVELRRRFGPEYDRTVREHGRREAETELSRREKRVERLHIRSLPREHQQQFADAWRAVQAKFVDDPGGAIQDADRLVGEVMRERGYPVGDFKQRAADVSVDHPVVVEHYRAAHEIALRHTQGEADTEDLRRAMVHYRALFEDLLEARVRVAGRNEEVER